MIENIGEPLSLLEVCTAPTGNNKAVGPDGISAKILKAGEFNFPNPNLPLTSQCVKSMVSMWETKGGILLLSIARKNIPHILLKRLLPLFE